MVALTLIGFAMADDLVAHVAVSGGVQAVPGVSGARDGSPAWALAALVYPVPTGFARFEAGLGPEVAQGYVVCQIGAHNGDQWDLQGSSDAEIVDVIGDFYVTQIGVGARLPRPLGPLKLVPHIDLGYASVDSPMDEAFYQSDVEPQFDQVAAVGLHAAGFWADVGGSVAYPIVEHAVDAQVSVDAGWIGVKGVGPTFDLRLGLAARF